jgi:hypothetical protein
MRKPSAAADWAARWEEAFFAGMGGVKARVRVKAVERKTKAAIRF